MVLIHKSGEGGGARAAFVAHAARLHVHGRRGAPRQQVESWLAQLIAWHLPYVPDVGATAWEVIEALLAAGDFGVARAFGQEVLVPLQPRVVLLSDGTSIAVGAWPEKKISDQADMIFPAVSPAAHGAIVNTSFDALTDSVAVSGLFARLIRGISLKDVVDPQLRQFLALEGRLDLRLGEWRLSDAALSMLGEIVEASDGVVRERGSPDPRQAAVIKSPPDTRLIVEAGPGRGKTWVVVERIARLVEQDVAPSRIWLLSFTRVAVEAMRARLDQIEASEAVPVHVSTFDSLAWNLLRQFSGQEWPGSFEACIEQATRLLDSDDPALEAMIDNLEHVVVDEAQDVTGRRLQLVEAFLNRLGQNCGITILGDPAQAIYGWQAVKKSSGRSYSSLGPKTSLLDDRAGFERVELQRDHRTESPDLAHALETARSVLFDANITPQERYDSVREVVEAAASRRVTESASDFPRSSDTMVLYRGRRALLAATHSLSRRSGRLRVRMPDRSDVVASWIGALLAGLPAEARLRRSEVMERFEDVARVLPALEANNIWDELRLLAENEGASFTVWNIYERLQRPLPSQLISKYSGSRGPLLGTIHGAKGLEASRVVLMLPPRPSADSDRQTDIDWDEEARILYVGASRARRELLIGSRRAGPIVTSATSSGRRWRGAPHDCAIEVGLDGDVGAPFSCEAGYDPRSAALRLLRAGGEAVPMTGLLVEGGTRYALYLASDLESDEEHAKPVGYLSSTFSEEVMKITRAAVLPSRITGFSMLGCTTSTWSSDVNGVPSRGVHLVPSLIGFAQFVSGGA